MHLLYICTMIYFTGHSFKKDAQWKAFDLWIKQASRWQRFSGLSHGEWSYWAPRTDLCKCSNLNHLIPPFWPTFHPQENNDYLNNREVFHSVFFPCKNDTLDTLDMSPFGSQGSLHLIYTDIPFPWGTQRIPNEPGGVNSTRLTASRSLSRGPGTLTVDGGVTNPSGTCGKERRKRVKQTQLGGIA